MPSSADRLCAKRPRKILETDKGTAKKLIVEKLEEFNARGQTAGCLQVGSNVSF
jgi:hypothetical protein